MTALCTLPGCGRPSEVPACEDCMSRFCAALRGVPGLVEDLLVAYSRTARIGGGSAGRRGASGLPYGTAAADALRALHAELSTAVRLLAEDRADHRLPADNPAAMAGWLLDHRDAIRTHHAARDLIVPLWWRDPSASDDEPAAGVIGAAVVVVDRPLDFSVAGRCEGCAAVLYMPTGRSTVTCRTPKCGRAYLADDLRHRALERARYMRITFGQITLVMLHLLDRDVPSKTVRSWIQRGDLVAVDHNDAGQPLYRVVDVQACARRRDQELRGEGTTTRQAAKAGVGSV